nr:15-hydroxyprostaglandin dehydrogenase [NAD(+)]-like isoform X2 [Halyomorpha halys]
MDVNCKIALITGGTCGIGLAIADSLLAAGLQKAYLSGIDDNQGSDAVGDMLMKHGVGKCDYMHIDVNNSKAFEDAFKYIICKDGSVDILVNNAGMLNDRQWELQFDTNVKGVIRGSLLANKYMPGQKNRGGCVLNITSISGFDCSPYSPGYNSSKHAVVGLTRAFGDAKKFHLNRVRHVAMGPGVTDTVMIDNPASRMLNEDWGKKQVTRYATLPHQSADAVGRGTVFAVEYGPPGSLWVVEDYRLQRVIPPRKETYMVKVIDL